MSLKRMKQNQDIKPTDWEKLAKSLCDTSESDQVTDLDEVVQFTDEVQQVRKMIQQVDTYFQLRQFQPAPAWKKVNARIHPTETESTVGRKLFLNPVFRIAAAVIFVALMLTAGYELIYNPSGSGKMLQISSAENVLNTFALPDGTLVSLNSDTKLFYPKRFTGETREVTIEGEAFFEVKPDVSKAFIIHAGKAQVKVLGTSFNVSAYPEKEVVEVIVETGKVEVLNKTNEAIQNLVPGEKGTLLTNNSLLKTTNLDPNFLAWKTRKLTFKASSLAEVVRNLEKVYKVEIKLADEKLSTLKLTAQFNDYPLDFILKVIETTFNIEVKKEKGQYSLKARS